MKGVMAKQSKIFGPGLFELSIQAKLGTQIEDLGVLEIPFFGEYQGGEAQLPGKLFGLNRLAEQLKQGPVAIDQLGEALAEISLQNSRHIRDVGERAVTHDFARLVEVLAREQGIRINTRPPLGGIGISDFFDDLYAQTGQQYMVRTEGRGGRRASNIISRALSERLAIDVDVDPFVFMQGRWKKAAKLDWGGSSFRVTGVGQITKPPYTSGTRAHIIELPHNLLWRPRDANPSEISSFVGNMIQQRSLLTKEDMLRTFTRKGGQSLLGPLFNATYARQHLSVKLAMARSPLRGFDRWVEESRHWEFIPELKEMMEGMLKKTSKGVGGDLTSLLNIRYPQFSSEGLALANKKNWSQRLSPETFIRLFKGSRISPTDYSTAGIRDELFRLSLNLDTPKSSFLWNYYENDYLFSLLKESEGQFTSPHSELPAVLRSNLPENIADPDLVVAKQLSETRFLKTRPQNEVASRIWKKILYSEENTLGFLRMDAIEVPKLPGILSSVEDVHAVSLVYPFADDVLAGWNPTTGGVKNMGGINYGTTAILPPTVTLTGKSYAISKGSHTLKDLFERIDPKNLMVYAKGERPRLWGHAEGWYSPAELIRGVPDVNPEIAFSEDAARRLQSIADVTGTPLENIHDALREELSRVRSVKKLAGSKVLDPFILKYDMMENGRIYEYLRSTALQISGSLGSEANVAFTESGTRLISPMDAEGIGRFANIHMAGQYSTDDAYWGKAFDRLYDLTDGNVSQYFRAAELMPGSFSRAMFTEGWGDFSADPRRVGKNISLMNNSFEAEMNILLADFEDLSGGKYPFGVGPGSYKHTGAGIAFETDQGWNKYSQAFAAREGGGPVHTSAYADEEFNVANFGLDMHGNPKSGFTRSALEPPDFHRGAKNISPEGMKIQGVSIRHVTDAEGRLMDVDYIYSIGEEREKGTLASLIGRMTGQSVPRDPGEAAAWAERELERMQTSYQIHFADEAGSTSKVARGFYARNVRTSFADGLGHVYPENPLGQVRGLDAMNLLQEQLRFVEETAKLPKFALQQRGMEVSRNLLTSSEAAGLLEVMLPAQARLDATVATLASASAAAKADAAAAARDFTKTALKIRATANGARLAQIQEMVKTFVMRIP